MRHLRVAAASRKAALVALVSKRPYHCQYAAAFPHGRARAYSQD